MKLNKEQEDLIIKLYQSGMSMNRIHLETQFATLTVLSVLKRRGIETRSKIVGILDKYSVEEVSEYYKTHNCEETEKHFNCNINSVYKKLSGKGLKKETTFYKIVDKEEFTKLFNEKSVSEIAEYYNVSVPTIKNTASKLNIRKIRKNHNYHHNTVTPHNFKEKQKEMVNYLADKYSSEDIAVLLGKTPARISQILKEA